MLQIDGKHDGRRFVIPVRIFGADNFTDMTSVEAMALVDTGATVSGIDTSLASELDLRPIGKKPIFTAHGIAQIDHYLFRVGVYPDGPQQPYPFIFPEVMGLALNGSEHFTALIGMDILRQCDFSMGRDQNCRLTFG